MPAQQGIWLHDHESLLPRPNQPGQQDEQEAIGPGERWPFHLPLENGQLVSQEGIFGNELRVASAQVGQCSKQEG
jgi:hypothetical protein